MIVDCSEAQIDIQMPEREPTGGRIPSKEWPSSGAISIKGLSLRYSEDLPEVLHDISLEIEVSHRLGKAKCPMTDIAWDAGRSCRFHWIRQIDPRA